MDSIKRILLKRFVDLLRVCSLHHYNTFLLIIFFNFCLSWSPKVKYYSMGYSFWAICKPRHWNLGIGTGIEIGIWIGTDTTSTIVSSSIRPMDIKPSRWWLRMREPHPQSHVTLQYSDHVTNKKCYISTFTRPMDPKFSSVVM